jgi:hypothetical protein
MKTLTFIPFILAVSTQSFAQDACPNLGGKFVDQAGGHHENIQTTKASGTSFTMDGIGPISLDGKTVVLADYSGSCESGTRIILNLSSRIVLDKTLAGFTLSTGGAVLETMTRE